MDERNTNVYCYYKTALPVVTRRYARECFFSIQSDTSNICWFTECLDPVLIFTYEECNEIRYYYIFRSFIHR